MKRLFLLLLSGIWLHAAQITWLPDYASAESAAKASGKRIFVFMSTEDCNWCRKLETTTFTHPDIVARLNRDYHAVHLTQGKDQYPAALDSMVVPMCYFLKADGTIIDYTRGYWDHEDFNLILNDVDKRLRKMQE